VALFQPVGATVCLANRALHTRRTD